MGYDAEQRKTIAALVAQGRKQGATRKEVLSAFETALTEASLRNPNYGDGSSVGWRQETSSSYPNANRLDLNASAARFYQELRGVRGKGYTPSQAAQAVQRSAFPGRYKQHQQEGVDLVHQFYDKGSPTVPKAAKAPTSKTVTTTPGVDNSTTRKQLLLSYVSNRHDPNALLSLASGLKDAQDVPATTKVVKVSAGKAAAAGKAPPVTGNKGTANFEGTTVAGWIAPILKYGRAHGWKGSVSSGFRSYADQVRIYNSGVRPAAVPGTSNHEGADFPRGAVDVSDAQTLSNILQRSPYAKTLVYAGSKDPVHFSHPHGGRY